MKTVQLTMTDSDNKTVRREIDITNAMHSGSECWELGGIESQRAALEDWIQDIGNEQSNTELTLVDWLIY